MLKQCVTAIGITLLAGPVSALSCMQPNITETFNSLADAPETYILALGTVTQTGPQQPLADGREGYRFAAHLTGMQVTQSGFDLPLDTDVEVQIACFDPWCGSVATDQQLIAFVQTSDTGLTIAGDLCAFTVFAQPSPATIQQAESCAAGQNCGPHSQ
jgi:hypothetical protein